MSFFRALFLCGLLCGLTACTSSFNTTYAAGRYCTSAVQCVPYARSASGINLHGDAYTWWDQANLPHLRGSAPMPGAVLVLAQTPRMTHGHLAVVKRVIDNRNIDVTQSNWGNDWSTRRIIYTRQRAQDVSQFNDWSLVRFWSHENEKFGFPYAAKGFIYQ